LRDVTGIPLRRLNHLAAGEMERISDLFNLGVPGSSYLKLLPILGGTQDER